METNNEKSSALYKGTISFTNMRGVDIGSLEGHRSAEYVLTDVAVHKSLYWCHYGLTEDARRINALMVVSVDYKGEELNTPEKLGEISVGLSGVVGFFRAPKTEYNLERLEQYTKDLQEQHPDKAWVHLNTRQFMAPAAQGLATRVPVFVHRNEQGEIDAIQMEFNRKADEELAEAVQNA
jgi:hypothetical protein